MSTVAVTNISKIVSGDIRNPLLVGDTIFIEDGVIRRIGSRDNIDPRQADVNVDAKGMVVTPGLIDSHCHPVVGDWSPRINTTGFLESALCSGVTTIISAGEVHLPGRPRDAAGTKALAILASKAYRNFRPGGAKVHGGAVILEPGLVESDFEEMARNGVWLVGEIGLGAVQKPEDAIPMVAWARKYGMKILMHCGGQSMPEGTSTKLEDVLAINPDIVCHINGGPTAISLAEVEALIRDTSYVFDIVAIGNPRIRARSVEWAKKYGALHRVMIGSDCPSGFGWLPYAVLRTVVDISALNDVAPEVALAIASGNTARGYGLAKVGTIAPGQDADLVVMDAPLGSPGADALEAITLGDVPGVSAVIVDGEMMQRKANYTPAPKRQVAIT